MGVVGPFLVFLNLNIFQKITMEGPDSYNGQIKFQNVVQQKLLQKINGSESKQTLQYSIVFQLLISALRLIESLSYIIPVLKVCIVVQSSLTRERKREGAEEYTYYITCNS